MIKLEKPYVWEPGVLFMHPGYLDEPTVTSVPSLFKRSYKEKWFEDPFNVNLVETIDNSKMVVPGVFRNPVIGNYSHDKISGGAMAVILLKEIPNIKVGIATMGDNCMEFLYEVTRLHEVHVFYEGYLPKFHPDQRILDTHTGLVFTAEESLHWMFTYALSEEKLFGWEEL